MKLTNTEWSKKRNTGRKGKKAANRAHVKGGNPFSGAQVRVIRDPSDANYDYWLPLARARELCAKGLLMQDLTNHCYTSYYHDRSHGLHSYIGDKVL